MNSALRLFEKKIGIPFPRVGAEKRCYASLEFQPILYWRDFNRDRGTEARSAALEGLANSRAQLKDGALIFLIRGFILINIGRLCQGGSGAEKEKR
jgi:hypothetical protein